MASINGPLDGFGKVQVNTPLDEAQAGYLVMLGESHDGAAGLTARRSAPAVSPEKRLRVGFDTPLWEDFFNHTVLNTRKYTNVLTTMTTALAGGLLTLNSGNSVATTVGDLLRTYKSFALPGNASIKMHAWFSLALVPQANNLIQIGWGIPNTATAGSSDGIFLTIDSAGNFSLNAYYNNATPTTSGTIAFTWVANKVYHAEIVIHRDIVRLYMDDVLVAEILRPSGPNTAGSLVQSQFGHMIAHLINTGATSGAQKLNLAGWQISYQDMDTNKTHPAIRAGNGDVTLSVPDGVAVAQLANYANSAAPASATLSNTAAGYTTLGGQFQFAAVAGAETDYALFAYQVPAGSAAAPGKSLVVTGIDIDAFNMGAAVATTPTLLQWSVGVGASAVSLATADAVTTRAAHRLTLGAQVFPIAAAVGARADRAVSADFSAAPLVVEPGTFLHVILKMPVGTATASQIVRGVVGIRGYFE